MRTYRFRGDNEYEDDDGNVVGGDLDSVVKNQIYFANVTQLNDPFESAALSMSSDAMEKFGVACFCRSVTNPLLWSHYANSHRGFAIGYDRDHEYFEKVQTVLYEDFPPDDPGMKMLEVVSIKPTCWAYEQEDRLVRETLYDQLKEVPPDAVKEIVFGLQMKEDRAKEIQQALDGRELKFGQMEADKGRYGVNLRWL